jgi:hypothetical protein
MLKKFFIRYITNKELKKSVESFLALQNFLKTNYNLTPKQLQLAFGVIFKKAQKNGFEKKFNSIPDHLLPERISDDGDASWKQQVILEIENFFKFGNPAGCKADERDGALHSVVMKIALHIFDTNEKAQDDFWAKIILRRNMSIGNIAIFKSKIKDFLHREISYEDILN